LNPEHTRVYADWYLWALQWTKDPKQCHAGAWAALASALQGGTAEAAANLGRKALHDRTAQASAATEVDPDSRAYAEWAAWAVTNLGVGSDQAHIAAGAALQAMKTGGDSHAAAVAGESAAGVHGEHTAADLAIARRADAFQRATRECPLPIQRDRPFLPGGIQLMDDEFLVTTAKDWGFSSQRIVMTTHRAIWTLGRINQHQNSLYLTDIRDVKFSKPLVGFGSISFETASGQVVEALPSVSNGAAVRNALLALIHYARQRSQQPQVVVQSAPASTPSLSIPDRYDQLRRLAELKDQGILSEAEFQSEKEKLLQS
jgi:hypothetical protein